MRGEDHLPTRKDFSTSRSPPHARGRLVQVVHCLVSVRITPACAGKTDAVGQAAAGVSDHPRMRGEDAEGLYNMAREIGSPPHARGRPAADDRAFLLSRITPACAGKT